MHFPMACTSSSRVDAFDIQSHLKERHLNVTLYPWSHDGYVASFLLFNLSGQLVGYHNYRPFAAKNQKNDPKTSRYYTYITNKALSPWGLESYNWRNDVLFLTEGIFDACRLHNLGLPAIATLSNDPKKLASWLRIIPRRKIAICDNDRAGQELAKFADTPVYLTGTKDLGELTDKEVEDVIRTSKIMASR
jgi:hypothetical protein